MSGNNLTVKERLAIPRVTMSELDPSGRSGNFLEVNTGLSKEQAMREAQRCLKCKDAPCVDGCPVQIDIPGFVAAIAEDDFHTASVILHRDNALPAVCGRVCPQEVQCEARCVLGVKGKPVAIGYLERFAADWALNHGVKPERKHLPGSSGKSVAVIGCGPAGITAAAELAAKGHSLKIFEALHDTGGVLRYGIPEFRLPKEIVDTEVARLASMGVEIECNVVVGKTITLRQVRDEYDAVFIGNGAGLPVMLGIPGENLKGVYSANEYLTRVNLMGAGQSADCATPHNQGPQCCGHRGRQHGHGLCSRGAQAGSGAGHAGLSTERGRNARPVGGDKTRQRGRRGIDSPYRAPGNYRGRRRVVIRPALPENATGGA